MRRTIRATRHPARKSTPSLLIVGIGASAGGLQAVTELFNNLPPDTGMAFVVVTHQPAGHTSMLSALLCRETEMPVIEATQNMELERNHVYVAPPGVYLAVLNGRLQSMESENKGPRSPIDYFFRSLAEDQQERAICIVLSGTGTDGTLGVKAIKAASGMAMVQEPRSAKYGGMPSSAADTGLADYVLPVARMSKQLIAYAKRRHLTPAILTTESPAVDDVSLQKMFVLLRIRTGNDFSGYKKSAVRRRIERRMNVHQIKKASEYVRYMQENLPEIDLLFKELLICVTSFFRDGEAWEALRSRLQKLIQSRPENQTLRAWVPGCATGEEAYSLAIELQECMASMNRHAAVQIFATDLDAGAIETARAGRYPDSIAVDVSPKRLETYFIRDDGTYRIRKEIREMVIFAPQNVINQPPFTRLDIVSCRNLLIYLRVDLQKKLLPVFHYALKPDGVLFLGPSETVGSLTDLFQPLDKRWKIFRRRERPRSIRSLPQMPVQRATFDENAATAVSATSSVGAPPVGTMIQRMLLRRFAPASVLVTEQGEILFTHGRTGAYLELAPGEPRNNLFDMTREGLQLELAAALRECARKGADVTRKNIPVKSNGDFVGVDLSVTKIKEPERVRGLLLVTFRTVTDAKQRGRAKGKLVKTGKLDRIESLERELQQSKESHQKATDELETSNEDLTSTNQEMLSINEELQSTNEELETSKEVLESTNEELTTLNAELESKLDELSQLNDDIKNLLNSTDVATVFLDNDLKLKRFTKPAQGLIAVRDTDIGRPMSDLASNLDDSALVTDCRTVLDTLGSKEREVRSTTGSCYCMRITPYRTLDNAVDGLVLTFVDITRLKDAERDLAVTRERMAMELEALTRLHEISALFFRESKPRAILDKVLDTAIFFTTADMGHIQLLDRASGQLTVRLQRGFEKEWLDVCASIDDSGNGCGAALKKGDRVIVEDVTKGSTFSGAALENLLRAGVHAFQSTPIVDRHGKVLGIISTHFKKRHRPDDHMLQLLDLLARLTADILERPEIGLFPNAPWDRNATS